MAARETVDGEEVWSIREVYDGTGWTARDAAPSASTHDELREVLRMMTFDIEHRDYLDLDAGVVAHRSGGLRAVLPRPALRWNRAASRRLSESNDTRPSTIHPEGTCDR